MRRATGASASTCGAALAAVEVRGSRARAVRLGGGERISCHAVLVAVGARAATDELAGVVPLAPDGGVRTDECGATAVPGVHACGDVASPWRSELGRHQRLEHWTDAASGAAAVAGAILGRPPSRPAPPYVWSDQFGWRLQMVGHPPAGSQGTIEDAGGGFVVRYRDDGGGLTAALAVNRPEDLPALRAELGGS